MRELSVPKSESGAGASPNPILEATGHGEAADGKVRVTVSINGANDAVGFDPRMMRQSADALAEYVCQALRAAHEELFEKLVEVDDASMADVRKKVDDLQASYTDRMEGYQRTLDDIARRLAE
jgi:DNA-binding protein YbaB